MIGLPESERVSSLFDIYNKCIPGALGVDTLRVAHQIGTQSDDRAPPRPMIVQFLNYGDRLTILQS